MEGFQYQLLKHTLESARAGAASPGAWGVAGGLHPAAPLPLQKLTPFSSLAPSAMGGFFAIYGWIFAVCSAGCTYFLHLGFLQLMLKRTLTLNQWIYGHRVFLRQFFYLACILFRCGICALRHSHHHARHCWWDSVYTHSPLSHF